MDALIGEELDVNIEYTQEGHLAFTLWRYNTWGEHEFCWFPVKFLQSLGTALRHLAVTFLHDLGRSNGIGTINDTDDVEYVFEWIEECLSNESDDRERRRKARLLESYRHGTIYRLLRRVERKRYCKNLEAALAAYPLQNERERQLVETMREGLQFIGDGKPSIMHYAYDPHYEREPDFLPLQLEQQIAFIYDVDDLITEYMAGNLSGCYQESYEIIPATILTLSPQIDRLFETDDYPDRFFRWADRFIALIHQSL